MPNSSSAKFKTQNRCLEFHHQRLFTELVSSPIHLLLQWDGFTRQRVSSRYVHFLVRAPGLQACPRGLEKAQRGSRGYNRIWVWRGYCCLHEFDSIVCWEWFSWDCPEVVWWYACEGLGVLECHDFLLYTSGYSACAFNLVGFLAPKGWSFSDVSAGKAKSFKGQLIGLIYATQYLRFPLILLNSLFVVVKLVSGWCYIWDEIWITSRSKWNNMSYFFGLSLNHVKIERYSIIG